MAFRKMIRGKLSTAFYVDIWVPDRLSPGAIHINKSTRLSDEAAALQLEEEWRMEAEERFMRTNSGLVDINDYTLSDALEWMKDHKWEHAVSGDRCAMRIEEIIEVMGDMPLSDLSGQVGADRVFAIRKKLYGSTNKKGRTRGKGTTDSYMATLRSLLKAMRNDRKIEIDVPKVPMFNEDNQRTRILRDEEQPELFKVLDQLDHEFGDYCRFLLDTGMRRSEALSIDFNKPMVDFKAGTVTVQTLKKKSKTAIRTVPLTKQAKDILLKRRVRTTGKAWTWAPNHASKKFQQAAGVLGPAYINDDGFCLHMLRHTCTTRLMMAGVNPAVVQQWMGHSTQKMSLYYSHAQPEHMVAGARVLDELNERVSVGVSVQAPEKHQKLPAYIPTM